MPRATALPKEAKIPEWGEFQLAMLNDAAYQRVSSATTSDRAVSRLELFFATQVENWPVAEMLWQLMIGGLPQLSLPQAEDIASWRAISVQTNMPITFDDNGLLKGLEAGQ